MDFYQNNKIPVSIDFLDDGVNVVFRRNTGYTYLNGTEAVEITKEEWRFIKEKLTLIKTTNGKHIAAHYVPEKIEFDV